MKILLFGKNGQLGQELHRAIAPLGDMVALSRQEADFKDEKNLRKIIAEHKPSVIINAVAYTSVDKAEQEPEEVFAINANALKIIAEEAKKIDAWLVHYSTDYVFDGTKKEPYVETDTPKPLCTYGKSKLAAEEFIQASGVNYLIFRTSWLHTAHGRNFATTMLERAKTSDELKIVADQHGAPTCAAMVANTTAKVLSQVLENPAKAEFYKGIYHLTASGDTTWYDYACYIFEQAQKKGVEFKVQPDKICPVSTEEYAVAAKRPKNSCLNTDKIKTVFGVTLPEWKSDVQKLVEEVVSK
jgi:dTDP-4-dehydrorhamnose reductase